MRTIPTKQIDGDVTVGRNVTAGGNAEVQGSARIGHDLKVEGWLEAKNIKSANKGLYTDPTKLREAYPRPHDGWFAGVSATEADFTRLGVTAQQGISYFVMYVGDGGEWVATDKLYQIVVDNEQVDTLRDDLTALQGSHNTLSGRVDGHDTQISQLQSNLTATNTLATTASNTATEANNRSRTNETAISQLRSDHTADVATLRSETAAAEGRINSKIGTPSGIAPLDGTGRVPAANLPGYVDDVVEFDSVEDSGITIQTSEINKLSTDADCAVFYDTASNKFVLGVMRRLSEFPITSPTPMTMSEQPEPLRKITIGGIETELTKSEFVALKKEQILSATTVKELNSLYREIYSVGTENNFTADDLHQFDGVYTRFFLYYDKWIDRELYADNNLVPHSGKVYVATETNKQYRWSGTTLTIIGSDLALGQTAQTAYPGDRGKKNAEDIAALQRFTSEIDRRAFGATFINANTYYNSDEPIPTLATAIGSIEPEHRVYGTVVTFLSDEEGNWKTYQWQGSIFNELEWADEEAWKPFGSGSASIGNAYNVTAERMAKNEPRNITGGTTFFDEFATAVAYAWGKGVATIGMQITFAIAANSWKSYQFIGTACDDPNDFAEPNNWIDMAGLTAGAEPIVNINVLYDTPTKLYNLTLAINALLNIERETKVTYRKPGLILTYLTEADKWESKQFTGTNIRDIDPTKVDETWWRDFGSGSNTTEITAKDEPEDGGKDAFSTGGAYEKLPVRFRKDTDTPGTVKLALVNENGEDVTDEVQFTVGTGTGGGGTEVSVNFEHSPLYAEAGGRVLIRAAIMSITRMGNSEVYNPITSVQLIDRTTKQVLETWRMNKASSPTAESFETSQGGFEFDISSYFTTAGSRSFQLLVTDDGDNTCTRNLTVIAVDLTIQSEQTLNYTASTSLKVGESDSPAINFYSFPNFSTEIKAVEEIYIDNEWHLLGTTHVKSNHTQTITINPNNCCGHVLGHGAYPIRVHGEDEKSGVVGSYLYSTIFVIDQNDTTPLVAMRWYSEDCNGKIRQYEEINVDFAVYLPGANKANAQVWYGLEGAERKATDQTVLASVTYSFMHRVTEPTAYDGSQTISIFVKSESGNTGRSQCAKFNVDGTLLDISEVAGAIFNIDFASRSNSEGDHTISNRGVTMDVFGANWTTNGFIKDTFGKAEYGTEADTGAMTLRIAENVTAVLNYSPFNDASIETNGMAIMFKVKKRNMAVDSATLISCISGGVGFTMTGEKFAFTTDNFTTQDHTIEVMLKEDTDTDLILVIEPTRLAPYGGIGIAKVFIDGDEAGACYYNAGSIQQHDTPVSFYGTQGEQYLHSVTAWKTYIAFRQAFNSYLLRVKNTQNMIEEYNFNDVMASTQAEGTTKDRPQADRLYERNIAYFVVCKSVRTAGNNDADQFPEYLETLDGDKKTKRTYDWWCYFPNRPWQDCVIEGMEQTNQGTTSSWDKVKNIKGKSKKATIRLLHRREEFIGNEYALAMYDECARNAAKGKIQIYDDSVPTNITTVKVDIQDASGANNGAMMQMFNELQKGLGSEYMTPAQNAYTGPYNLNTSIDSIPVAYFRTDRFSPDATSPIYGYFHCKGNFNQDKGDAKVFGFEDVDGYNKGCRNYGEFIEVVAPRDANFENYISSLDKSEWVPCIFETDSETGDVIIDEATNKPVVKQWNLYMVSEFCGPKYKFFRWNSEDPENGAWEDTTGTMRCTNWGAVQQLNVKPTWEITGDVLNPVECIELRKYDGFCWLQGCDSIDDLTAISDGKPVWLQYFESRYPDDDNLNALYEAGKKVPYQLYRYLRFMQDCNHNLDETHGNITIGGVSVPGTRANRLRKYKQEYHKVGSVKSTICYKVTIHYGCSGDQESKNAMIAWYLCPDGVIRAFWNHMYDGDNQWGLGNNSAFTIPVTVNMDTDEGIYQGYDSVVFKQMAAVDEMWLNDSGTSTTTVHDVAKAMRNCTLPNGVKPFSPEGVFKYWITDRLSKWPKVVSSFDGERKYIDTATPTYNKIYGVHGLGIQRLQQFVKQRFEICDGYFQVGDIYRSVMKMRATGNNINIRLKAAKDGYFGIGVDQAAEAIEGAYLRAGETITLHSGVTNNAGGMLITIFGANKIAELDLSEATPSQNNWDISECVLLRKLILGGEDWTGTTNSEGCLKTLNLGNKPFLEELDIRGTHISSLVATYCPRINTILAENSELQDFTLAETSPIETLQLPSAIQKLPLVNLPNLSYPGGLSFQGVSNITKVVLSGCPKIDPLAIINNVIANSTISQIRMTDLNITAKADILRMLKNAKGLDENGREYSETGRNSGLTGRWILTDLLPDEDANELNAYFPELEVYIYQYSVVCYDDTEDYCENITNLDNNTGYLYYNDYVASGHFKRLEEMSHAVRGKYNADTKEMVVEALDDSNYNRLADGTSCDLSDSAGLGYDFFKHVPSHWYKGINDFKNQRKYSLRSVAENEPISTASRITRAQISTLLVQANSALASSVNVVGNEPVITSNASNNVYAIDVEGMKQVRWPGINSNTLCCVFIDEDGNIVRKFSMSINSGQFDFIEGEDYLFCNVPTGAVRFLFTSPLGSDSQEAIAVDSAEVEAIEPDWVYRKEFLVGIYGMGRDRSGYARSISGTKAVVGEGSGDTSDEWTYDEEGRCTNIAVPNPLSLTRQDFINLCEMRGEGFHAISYEQSKDLANIIMELVGTRDIQAYCGRGMGAGYTTGTQTINGKNINAHGNVTLRNTINNVGNLMFGIQNFVACNVENIAHVAANVISFKDWKAKHCPTSDDDCPIDDRFHIYDIQTGVERVVQGIKADYFCVGRVRHGRFMDILPSVVTNDNSQYNKNYACAYSYTHEPCRAVIRANNRAGAAGGIIWIGVLNSNASSAGGGSRLAYSGKIVWL